MLNASKKNLIVVAVALLASAASAVVKIRVSQESSAGAGDFSSHVLGTNNAREYSTGTAADYTDGFAIGSLDGTGWSMLGEFTAAPTGITSLAAYSDGGSTIGLNMATGRRVKYEIVPEPATMSLLGIGGLLALVRRRRK